MTDIVVSQLNGTGVLPDRDKIRLEIVPGKCDKADIQIGLRLDGVTWWKGVEADDMVLAQSQDSRVLAMTELSFQMFASRSLNLWKAKAFGVHTYMYTVVDAHENFRGGNRYVFNWLAD